MQSIWTAFRIVSRQLKERCVRYIHLDSVRTPRLPNVVNFTVLVSLNWWVCVSVPQSVRVW